MVHLHTRSSYSFLKSPNRIEDIIQKAKESGQTSVALTEKDALYSLMPFLKQAKEAGLKPIVGLEADIRFESAQSSLLFYAKDETGLQSLYKLAARLSDKEPLKPEEVKDYTSHVILLSPGMDDYVFGLLSAARSDQSPLFSWLSFLKEQAEEVYIAISENETPYLRELNEMILKPAANELGLKTVALSRIDYLEPDGFDLVRLMYSIDHNQRYIASDTSLNPPYGNALKKGRCWHSKDEMDGLYAPEDLSATDEIAQMIHLDADHLPKSALPHFETGQDMDANTYLRKLCSRGLRKRLNDIPDPVYEERLVYELSVIESMGFADYFLIVYDIIREARKRGIMAGPGRGSAAGSLVSYVLGISHVDPVANGLLFERFLNPERISMPDIDMDFPDNRRDEMVEYVRSKYGADHIAHIAALSTYKTRSAFRDVAKAYGKLPGQIDDMAALIDATKSLKENAAMDGKFKTRLEAREWRQITKDAIALEGLPRHATVHAAGILFSRKPLEEVIPVSVEKDVRISQVTMEHLEALGLIKFDFLGILNLQTLDETRLLIEKETGRPLNILDLPLNDPKTYSLISNGDTFGIFQLEKQGMISLLKDYQPKVFADIAAILALYRPGPMQNIGLYLSARKNPGSVKVIHPLLEPILKETGGIFLYQEQIMKAAVEIGGLSLAQADTLRKAMSKKQKGLMETYKAQFTDGAISRGLSPEQADQVFELMERFSDYGFNKSHSYAYALIVYQMAWTKANYPAAFFTASLNTNAKGSAKCARFVQEARGRGLIVAPADLSQSEMETSYAGNAIRLGFSAIKPLPTEIARRVLEERKARGPFSELYTTCARLFRAGLKKDHFATLISAGAFDAFGLSRSSMLENLDGLFTYGKTVNDDTTGRLFDFTVASPPDYRPKEEDILERLKAEKSCYGFYLSDHPARQVRARHPKARALGSLGFYNGWTECAGIITRLSEKQTRKKETMCFATIEDESASFELAIMPDLYAAMKEKLQSGQLILAQGMKSRPSSMVPKTIEILDLNTYGKTGSKK